MKYSIWWNDITDNIADWISKDVLEICGFDDKGYFATYNINEVYQKLERIIHKYQDRIEWKFEVREKQ